MSGRNDRVWSTISSLHQQICVNTNFILLGWWETNVAWKFPPSKVEDEKVLDHCPSRCSIAGDSTWLSVTRHRRIDIMWSDSMEVRKLGVIISSQFNHVAGLYPKNWAALWQQWHIPDVKGKTRSWLCISGPKHYDHCLWLSLYGQNNPTCQGT